MNIEKESSKAVLAFAVLQLLMKAATKDNGDVDITHLSVSLGIEEQEASTMYLLWLETQLDDAA